MTSHFTQNKRQIPWGLQVPALMAPGFDVYFLLSSPHCSVARCPFALLWTFQTLSNSGPALILHLHQMLSSQMFACFIFQFTEIFTHPSPSQNEILWPSHLKLKCPLFFVLIPFFLFYFWADLWIPDVACSDGLSSLLVCGLHEGRSSCCSSC